MNIAVLLSGGKGLRMGTDVPKQYISVAGKPIISYAIDTLVESKRFGFIQIVCEKEYENLIKRSIKPGVKFGFSAPGENRQLSILNALRDVSDLADNDSYVFIHDAARPCLSYKMIENCFEAVSGHDGVLPVLPMKDTVYECDKNGKIVGLLERERIFAGQAPELFRYKEYLDANESLSKKQLLKIHGSTEPAIMAGLDVVTIRGDEENFKITTPIDLEKYKNLFKH
ncbi:MAG: 2-C-methyl-D-erythritol 4-phosphate cytidylyltransferase [Lachnospiraceae bacterium]|nr:2-C-methyl-D-erythritol 4-phosphate cytidylyltransferase [Lachnospiraceae bacterium]